MHAPDANTRQQIELVEIIDLKWLLAGHGLHLHVEKLQCDAEYARRTFDFAEGSGNPALRAVAARLRPLLVPA